MPPPFHSSAKALCGLAIAGCIAGCSPNAELAKTNAKLQQANQRIAALEAQLAQVPQASPSSGTSAKVRTEATPLESSAASAAVTPIAALTGQQWRYDADEEKMTGGKRKTASVDSTNTVNFGFPYGGDQNGHLTLRTDPRHGKDVIFRIEQGQILCPSYEGCVVQVRFDDDKPVRFSASGAADHSTEVVFLNDYSQFLSKLKKAKRVCLAVNIYQNGTPVFEFDVSGFDFDKYQAKS